jgi:hypothetical protein
LQPLIQQGFFLRPVECLPLLSRANVSMITVEPQAGFPGFDQPFGVLFVEEHVGLPPVRVLVHELGGFVMPTIIAAAEVF